MMLRMRDRLRPAFILFVIIAALTPLIVGKPFWLDNSILIAVFSLMALSVGMSYGQAGILSVATAGFASVGAYATSIVTAHYGLSPLLGLLLAIVLPMLLGYPMARAITRLSPMPLSIATLLLSMVLEIAIREGGDFTGGYIGLSGIPNLPFASSLEAMHVLSWAIVVVVIALYANLTHSAIGRAVKTARHDPLRATADGVDVPKILASYFALSAAVAGVAGWLYAHHLMYMGPDSLTIHVSIKTMLMTVIGGAQTFLGPVLGAAFLTMLTLYLPASEAQGMIFGATLVFVLLVTPRGILGTDWLKLLSRSKKRETPIADVTRTSERTA
ncbi:branched-chain amino acid ABC transporter permease [Tardiphaga sp.]|jgi:branched-chain amino acid transport system permease protein|uniref:branched-chain amino acid ABC transporter permease n=1 Tax=Tardiphaga sp. TaxID=1926292 RepID=UPI0037DA40D4